MHTARGISVALSLLLAAATGGCATEIEVGADDYTKPEPDADGKYDSSAEAVFLDFDFDGELFTSSSWGTNQRIEDQLLYTIGQLNGERAVGRLDKLVISDVETESVEGGVHVSYHASLLVAWGKKNAVPSNYELIMPRDASSQGFEKFASAYSHDCVDWGAHDVDAGSMWYYYRPARSSCDLADEDVVRLDAAVSISDINTTGKFPEYDKVWEDGVLKVVAVFGKYEDGATSGDAGISAYNNFVSSMKNELASFGVTTVPASVSSAPGVTVPEVQFAATMDAGHAIEIVVILVDNVRTAGYEFDQRYGELSERADLIVYNGHAGLGANIRALANKGSWVTGQYAIVFMNGCDTYAYVDSALFDAHAAVNSDDAIGTKYVDIVTNAMPSFFSSMSNATRAMVRGLMAFDAPRTYEQIFADIDRSEIVLVSGEQDNEFVPGGGGEPPVEVWEGLAGSGTVAKNEETRWQTPQLPAGRYVFEMTGTSDADLYTRIGNAPTAQEYDCRPYKTGSNEVCTVELTAPTTIHVMVRGYATSSTYDLVGRPD